MKSHLSGNHLWPRVTADELKLLPPTEVRPKSELASTTRHFFLMTGFPSYGVMEWHFSMHIMPVYGRVAVHRVWGSIDDRRVGERGGAHRNWLDRDSNRRAVFRAFVAASVGLLIGGATYLVGIGRIESLVWLPGAFRCLSSGLENRRHPLSSGLQPVRVGFCFFVLWAHDEPKPSTRVGLHKHFNCSCVSSQNL